MVKYRYDPLIEGFKRVDNRGRPLLINISEARQIESYNNLGYSISEIYSRMIFNQNVTITTTRTFINNLENGNISLEGDYPAPKVMVDDFTYESRIDALEERIVALEKIVFDSDKKGIVDKVKKWL